MKFYLFNTYCNLKIIRRYISKFCHTLKSEAIFNTSFSKTVKDKSLTFSLVFLTIQYNKAITVPYLSTPFKQISRNYLMFQAEISGLPKDIPLFGIWWWWKRELSMHSVSPAVAQPIWWRELCTTPCNVLTQNLACQHFFFNSTAIILSLLFFDKSKTACTASVPTICLKSLANLSILMKHTVKDGKHDSLTRTGKKDNILPNDHNNTQISHRSSAIALDFILFTNFFHF